MDGKYKIYEIAFDLDPIIREDDDETINKAWYRIEGLGDCLFKAATTTPGSLTEYRTDWSEKVVERLANLLGLPVAQYELAIAYLGDSLKPIEGVISVNCIPENAAISSGGFFIRQTFDDALRRSYTVENILDALDTRDVKPSSQWAEKIPEIDTGAKVFVGYLLLDALVYNEDRHGANWGVMSIEGTLELISSFDHGVSLGSRNRDEDKLSRSFFEHINESSFSHFKDGEGSLSVFNAFVRAAKLYPGAAKIWQDKLAAINTTQIKEIFDNIPEERITPLRATFAQQLLEYNQALILSVNLESSETLAQTKSKVDIFEEAERQVQAEIDNLKKEVREACNLPQMSFDDNMLSFMEDFIRNRIEKVDSVGEVNTTTYDKTSEYELEVRQRLFDRVAEDITVLGTSNNLDILESYIREEMAAGGVSDPQESIIGYVTPEDERIDLIDSQDDELGMSM